MSSLKSALSLTLTPLYTCCSSSSSTKHASFPKSHQPNSIIKLKPLALGLSLLRPPLPLAANSRLRFSVQELAVEQDLKPDDDDDNDDDDDENQIKRKLYLANLPWSLSVADMKTLFGQCGTVVDVDIIKQRSGKSRGFAFITMETGEEAQAVIDKFNLQEVSGRVVRVEFANRFKKPSPPRPPGSQPGETHNKLYVGNLEWKARSSHLREFLLGENFKPLSARIVFDGANKRSSGYGFISFATKEEAEAALSLDGKELMGRPLRVKISERTKDEAGKPKEDEGTEEDQPEES